MSEDINPVGSTNPEPTHQLTLEIKEEYLLAQISGQRTRAAVSSFVTEIAHAAIEYKRGKILIDVRGLEGWLSVFDSYYIVTDDFPQFRDKGIVKAAIVDRPLPKLSEWFFETVAHNRGYNLRIFESPVVALDWLLGPKTEGENRNSSVN
jgi:hypothetical protein